MKYITLAGLALGLLTSSTAMAQGGRGGGKRVYDPATVETVQGKVVALDTIVSADGICAGVHATLDATAVGVHLGPVWYLETLTTQLHVGDQVSVTGSRVTIEGKAALIAAEVKRGQDVLTLRDQSGRPVWAGRRHP